MELKIYSMELEVKISEKRCFLMVKILLTKMTNGMFPFVLDIPSAFFFENRL